MAKAVFFVNDIKVHKQGKYLVLEAQNKCQHGTVFDEVFLSMPANLAGQFSHFQKDEKSDAAKVQNQDHKKDQDTGCNQNTDSFQSKKTEDESQSLADHFKRFSADN